MSLPSPVHSHDQHTYRLLAEIEAREQISQRSLARSVGIALGLTNLILRRLVRKGWVRMVHIKPNRVSYLLTPAGIAEKARISRDSLRHSVRFYAEARERIRSRFATLSTEWPGGDGEEKRIVFFGTGEVAEIGYICLHETDLKIIGAIDDQGKSRFFDVPLQSPAMLRDGTCDGKLFGRLIVMSFENAAKIQDQLVVSAIPLDHVFWI